jgi:hypothetical protein
MRVVRAAPDVIELRARGSVGTPLLVGSVMLCWPILALLLAPDPPTAERWLALAIVAALALVFIRAGWPRRRVIRMDPAARTVSIDGTPPVPFIADAALRLVAAPSQPVAGPMRYGVSLEGRGMFPLLVLAGDDPGKVLRDVMLIRAHLPLPVHVGWGLGPASLPWLARSRGGLDGSLGAWRKDDPVEPTRRRATTVLAVGSAAAAGLLFMEIHGRASRGDVASPISLVLPVLGVLVLVGITYVMATLKPHLSAASDLVCEWRIGSWPIARRSVHRAKVRSAEVVSPSGNAGRHLLLDVGDDGFLAFRCDKDEGTRVARLVTGADP